MRIQAYTGREGFVDRFVGTVQGRRVAVRWVARGNGPDDAVDRLVDAATFLERHAHPGLPVPMGTVRSSGGAGIVLDTAETARLRPGPADAGVVASVLFELAELLVHLKSVNPREAPRLRALGLDTLRVRADGRVVFEAVEAIGGMWPRRIVRTGNLSRAEQAALPFPPEAAPEDDVFDLGLVAVHLLAGTDTHERVLTALDRAVGWEGVLTRVVEPLPEHGALVRRLLAWHLDERPDPDEVVAKVMAGATERAAVAGWLRPSPGKKPHALLGQELRFTSTTRFRPGGAEPAVEVAAGPGAIVPPSTVLTPLASRPASPAVEQVGPFDWVTAQPTEDGTNDEPDLPAILPTPDAPPSPTARAPLLPIVGVLALVGLVGASAVSCAGVGALWWVLG